MKRTLSKLATTVAASSAALLIPAGIAQASIPPHPAVPLAAPPCHASVSNTAPKDYSTVIVYVNTTPGPSTRITTAAHYKTVTTIKTTTDPKAPKGRPQPDARTSYYISDAKPGFKVVVDATVRIGTRSSSCATSFTPKR
jgi:hypothetical protein